MDADKQAIIKKIFKLNSTNEVAQVSTYQKFKSRMERARQATNRKSLAVKLGKKWNIKVDHDENRNEMAEVNLKTQSYTKRESVKNDIKREDLLSKTRKLKPEDLSSKRHPLKDPQSKHSSSKDPPSKVKPDHNKIKDSSKSKIPGVDDMLEMELQQHNQQVMIELDGKIKRRSKTENGEDNFIKRRKLESEDLPPKHTTLKNTTSRVKLHLNEIHKSSRSKEPEVVDIFGMELQKLDLQAMKEIEEKDKRKWKRKNREEIEKIERRKLEPDAAPLKHTSSKIHSPLKDPQTEHSASKDPPPTKSSSKVKLHHNELKDSRKSKEPEVIDVFGMELQKLDRQAMEEFEEKAKRKLKRKNREEYSSEKRKLEPEIAPLKHLPSNPSSEEYRNFQVKLWQRINRATSEEACQVFFVVKNSGCIEETEKDFEFTLDKLDAETIKELQRILQWEYSTDSD